MSAINPSSTAPSLRRLPFTVRLSPQFINRLLSRRQQVDPSPDNVHGLLFGIADDNLLVVQAFRSFAGTGEKSTRPSEMFERFLAGARQDPEISPLELVGWYASRPSGGLLQSDIQFHDLHFKRPSDLALVLKPEGDTDVLMELYCRSAEGVLSGEGHRWGAVRQALGSTLVGPVEVTMRSKIQDDFFLRAYQVSSPEEEEGGPNWKSTIQFTTRKAWKRLALSRPEKAPKISEAAQASTKKSEPAPQREGNVRSQTATGIQQQLPPGVRESREMAPSVTARKPPADYPSPQGGNTTGTSLQTIRAGAPPSVPALIPDAPRRYNIPWVSSALVFAVAAGLTFGLVYSRGLSSGDNMPGFLKGFFPASGLGLRLESQGDRLLLSWNRHHPAVRNARGGVLQIDDGPQHRQVGLDAAQVLNGSVLYRPISDDVTFRLEIEGTQGGKVSESMRVLEAARPGTLDLSAPAAAPSAGNAIEPQKQLNNTGSGRQVAGQIANAPAQTSTTVITQKIRKAAADSPVVNPPPVSRPPTRAVDTQSAPPPHVPMDVPVKQKAEAQGQVNFDVVSTAPAQSGNGESAAPVNSNPSPANNSPAPSPTSYPAETVRNTPQREPNTTSAPITEKQNPLSTPSSAPPLNTAVPTTPSPKSTPGIYRAPRPLRQVLPNTSLLLPGVLAAAGRVEVIVKVNETGHVTETRLVNGGKKLNTTVAGASILAARQWVFAPATINGRPVPSEHSIVFQFQAPK